jgi:glycine betaine/choline ABC-type transport system substrate-binding protein
MNKLVLVALPALLCAGGCGASKKPVVVGSKNTTEQLVLGEIVAQHLEHRLQITVTRQLGLGDTEFLYQQFSGGSVTLYPEYTGVIAGVILREQPSPDPAVALERARNEMKRRGQAELIGPLGFENPPAIVIRAADGEKLTTLSDAVAGSDKWKMAATFDFQRRPDGLPLLSNYRIPMSAPMRFMNAADLFPLLDKGEVTMVTATETDGHLVSDKYKVLRDDKDVFPPQQVCLLVRQDSIAEDPRLQAALKELAGKFTSQMMRKLNAIVDVDKGSPADAARQFFSSAGLN